MAKKRNNRGIKGQLSLVFGNVCYYCKGDFGFDDLTVDHKIPESRGGGHYFSNLALACDDCNSDKRDMTEEEYWKYREMSELDKQRFLNKLWHMREDRERSGDGKVIPVEPQYPAPKKEQMMYKVAERWPGDIQEYSSLPTIQIREEEESNERDKEGPEDQAGQGCEKG